jgi:lauroyl/myristoyl acyltransferase
MRRENEIIRSQAAVAKHFLETHPDLLARVRELRPGENLADISIDALPSRITAHYGEMIGELLIFDTVMRTAPPREGTCGFPDFPCFHGVNYQLVKKLVKEPTPELIISGHIGNFESLAAFYAKCGKPLSTIGREANYPVFHALIEEIRRTYGVENISRGTSTSIGSLRRALKGGRTIAALIDQDTNLDSVFVPFFGIEAATPIAPIALAVRHRLPVISAFIVRTGRLQHTIVAEEVPYDPENPDAVRQIAAAFSRLLELLAAAYPEQWPWWHRRWRRRPGIDYRRSSDQLKSTAGYLAWLAGPRTENAA